MPHELYVNGECYHSRAAMDMLAKSPPDLQREVRINQVDFKSAPPQVTKVPTLILQDGTMLVGPEVFEYIRKQMKRPWFPHTDVDRHAYHAEQDVGLFTRRNIVIVALLILAMYLLYQHR